jgi:hypothetical protein
MEFYCSVCNYNSGIKKSVERHINKKTKCGDGNLEIVKIKADISCEFCKKSFATKPSLNRHIITCKVKKENLKLELSKVKIQLEESNKKLAVAEALAKKPSVNITNNNINIQLSPWNDPRLPDDVEKYYKLAVKKVFLAIPTLINAIHFNEDHPENHNICIKNARNKTAKVYNGKEWETMDEDDLIRTLITDYEQTLEDYSDTKNLTYNEKIREIKDRDSEETVYDDLHNIVKRTLYDKNHMVKTKNK